MQKHMVMIADDDPSIRQVLSFCFQQHGYDVLGASDGYAAVSLARAQQPEVIVLDLMMPGSDGWEAIAELRRDPRTSWIPVIALSALVHSGIRERLQLAGFTSCLGKPVRLRQLRETVRRCITLPPGETGWLEPAGDGVLIQAV